MMEDPSYERIRHCTATFWDCLRCLRLQIDGPVSLEVEHHSYHDEDMKTRT